MLSTNECQSPSALAVTVASGHAPARLHCGSRNLRQALGYNFALLAFGNALLKQHFQIKERLFLIRGGGEQSLLGIRTRRAAMTSRLWRCCSVTWGKGGKGSGQRGQKGAKGQVLTVACLGQASPKKRRAAICQLGWVVRGEGGTANLLPECPPVTAVTRGGSDNNAFAVVTGDHTLSFGNGPISLDLQPGQAEIALASSTPAMSTATSHSGRLVRTRF